MATPTVSGNANQAVANDDFEAYQREANKADLEARFGKQPKVEPPPEPVAEPKPDPKQAEPERKTEKPKSPGNLSYKELRERVRTQEAELERLRATGKTPELAEPEPEPEPEAKVETKARPRPKSTDTADGKPKYETWEAYEDDLLAWNTEKVLQTIDERSAKQQREARIEATNKTIEQSWRERVNKSREAHADYDEVALSENGPGKLIGPGSIVDEHLMESEHGAELLYYFGQHPDELKKFGNYPGTRTETRRALIRLEDKLIAADPKPKPTAAESEPEKRVTKAPKPTSEVGGRGTASGDPITKAVADDDFTAFQRAANAKDIRERFGDRR